MSSCRQITRLLDRYDHVPAHLGAIYDGRYRFAWTPRYVGEPLVLNFTFDVPAASFEDKKHYSAVTTFSESDKALFRQAYAALEAATNVKFNEVQDESYQLGVFKANITNPGIYAQSILIPEQPRQKTFPQRISSAYLVVRSSLFAAESTAQLLWLMEHELTHVTFGFNDASLEATRQAGNSHEDNTAYSITNYRHSLDFNAAFSLQKTIPTTLQPYDVVWAEFLHGRKTPNAAGDTVYRLSDAKYHSRLSTLLDTDGIDTLDLSACENSRINLHVFPPAGIMPLTACDDAQVNLGPAVTIENAICGPGLCTVYLNPAANVIDTRLASLAFIFTTQLHAGIDVILGQGGNSKIVFERPPGIAPRHCSFALAPGGSVELGGEITSYASAVDVSCAPDSHLLLTGTSNLTAVERGIIFYENPELVKHVGHEIKLNPETCEPFSATQSNEMWDGMVHGVQLGTLRGIADCVANKFAERRSETQVYLIREITFHSSYFLWRWQATGDMHQAGLDAGTLATANALSMLASKGLQSASQRLLRNSWQVAGKAVGLAANVVSYSGYVVHSVKTSLGLPRVATATATLVSGWAMQKLTAKTGAALRNAWQFFRPTSTIAPSASIVPAANTRAQLQIVVNAPK